jgi:hypothetical protein
VFRSRPPRAIPRKLAQRRIERSRAERRGPTGKAVTRASDARRRTRSLNAEGEDCHNRRRTGDDGGDERLCQRAARDGRDELALGVELTDRAGIGIMSVLARLFGAHRGDRARSAGLQTWPANVVLAPQKVVQTLAEQHHPRIEDEHSDDRGRRATPRHRIANQGADGRIATQSQMKLRCDYAEALCRSQQGIDRAAR